jgi:hypothetical protein
MSFLDKLILGYAVIIICGAIAVYIIKFKTKYCFNCQKYKIAKFLYKTIDRELPLLHSSIKITLCKKCANEHNVISDNGVLNLFNNSVYARLSKIKFNEEE